MIGALGIYGEFSQHKKGEGLLPPAQCSRRMGSYEPRSAELHVSLQPRCALEGMLGCLRTLALLPGVAGGPWFTPAWSPGAAGGEEQRVRARGEFPGVGRRSEYNDHSRCLRTFLKRVKDVYAWGF